MSEAITVIGYFCYSCVGDHSAESPTIWRGMHDADGKEGGYKVTKCECCGKRNKICRRARLPALAVEMRSALCQEKRRLKRARYRANVAARKREHP